VDEKSR